MIIICIFKDYSDEIYEMASVEDNEDMVSSSLSQQFMN